MLYRLSRSGETDLELDGDLIAEESTRAALVPGPRRPGDPTRWTEVRIYRLASGGGWVTEMTGKSARPGEVDRPRVTVCRTPVEVRDSLRRRSGDYIINAALHALGEAADQDPRLLPATVERV